MALFRFLLESAPEGARGHRGALGGAPAWVLREVGSAPGSVLNMGGVNRKSELWSIPCSTRAPPRAPSGAQYKALPETSHFNS